MKISKIKFLSLGATLLGLAATLVTNYVSEKSLAEKVEEEVAKALKNKNIGG